MTVVVKETPVYVRVRDTFMMTNDIQNTLERVVGTAERLEIELTEIAQQGRTEAERLEEFLDGIAYHLRNIYDELQQLGNDTLDAALWQKGQSLSLIAGLGGDVEERVIALREQREAADLSAEDD
jgi:uncharacterized protein (UPF0335 family)